MKIPDLCFYGPLSAYDFHNTCFQRASAISEVVPDIRFIDVRGVFSFTDRLLRKTVRIRNGLPLDYRERNILISKCETAFIESPWLISINQLKMIRRNSRKIIMNFVDNLRKTHNQHPLLMEKLQFADWIVTTKAADVEFFRAAYRLTNVCLIDNGANLNFWPDAHFYKKKDKERDLDFTFFGLHENIREEKLLKLVDSGYKVGAAGFGWNHPYITCLGNIFDQKLRDFLCRGRVSINFLRNINEDTQTTRSIELPAMRVPTIHQASNCHRRLFGANGAYFHLDNFVEDCRQALTSINKTAVDECFQVVKKNHQYQVMFKDVLERVI